MEKTVSEFFKVQLSGNEFNLLSNFIYRETGIKMPPEKKIMLQSRLQKRLRSLNMTCFREYCDYVFSGNSLHSEIIHLIDVVTTNKTDFFREPHHFEYMTNVILPEIAGKDEPMHFWSAGCSSGEEPYTLAMIVMEFLESQQNLKKKFSILGTDISTAVLQKAYNAIYKMSSVEGIPLELKRKYFLKSKIPGNNTVKIVQEVRQKVMYKRLNFMDSKFDIKDQFNIIFCRNVLIYFDRETQENVIRKLIDFLKPGGYIFLGHSESILGMDLPLIQIKPTIFKLKL